MKNLSKKALLSILSLVLTFVALGATTFAWFSLGTTATVNEFEVEVKGGEGLEIQLDGSNDWYSVLNTEMITKYIRDKYNAQVDTADEMEAGDNFVMDALTSKDGISFYGYNFSGNDLEHREVHDEATANKDYIQLKFKLRTESLKAINISSLIVSEEESDPDNNFKWPVDLGFTLARDKAFKSPGDETTEADKIEARLSDALRVSFVVGENPTEGIVFEKDDSGTSNTNTIGTVYDLESNIGGFEYFARKLGYSNESGITLNPAADWKPVDPDETERFGPNLTKKLFSASASGEGYREFEVTVNIWFEGYDNEAFDAVLDQLVKIQMAFSLAD